MTALQALELTFVGLLITAVVVLYVMVRVLRTELARLRAATTYARVAGQLLRGVLRP